MATSCLRPLSSNSCSVSLPKPQITVSGAKRPRSPEVSTGPSAQVQPSKRVKCLVRSPPSQTCDKAKERKHLEREQQRAEFREKFTRAFPGFVFYFDEFNAALEMQDRLEEMIERLGGKTVKFLDKTVTHFITNCSDTTPTTHIEKENNPRPLGNLLKSPIKLKYRIGEDIDASNLLPSALSYKVWNTTKLESVLTRLLDPFTPATLMDTLPGRKQISSLARLLKSEQTRGSSERDPSQRRYDFKYFARGSKFVLVEDLRQDLATIAVQEYIGQRGRDGVNMKTPWPVLHCHPQARGPFIAFDEKEKRRWEKSQKPEQEHTAEGRTEHAQTMRRRTQAKMQRDGDLRRCVSMTNIHRKIKFPDTPQGEHLLDPDGDGENFDSVIASGFLASGYMAASGNSVNITSTTGATSTAGYPRNFQLPSALAGRTKHILTSLKFPFASADKENRAPSTGPPVFPEKQFLLRKSRSTTALKPPKREEGVKPGYCENCRIKFDDFKLHITSRKHLRFATSDANFLQLDCVLDRVQRHIKRDVLAARLERATQRKLHCNSAHSSQKVFSTMEFVTHEIANVDGSLFLG